MKIRKLILWMCFMLAGLLVAYSAVAADAADGVSTSAETDNLLMALIPVIVPLIIALGKWALPKVPKWILPILAPALGALVDFLTTWATGAAASPWLGAVLGSAGVGVRELLDQVRGRLKDGSTLPLLLLAVALPAATLSVGVTGCAGTPKETVIYSTFRSSWIVSKTAYDVWIERVVQGKVTPESEAKADEAWNKYRGSFKVALALATTNWSSQTPASLNTAQKELLDLLTLLSQ